MTRSFALFLYPTPEGGVVRPLSWCDHPLFDEAVENRRRRFFRTGLHQQTALAGFGFRRRLQAVGSVAAARNAHQFGARPPRPAVAFLEKRISRGLGRFDLDDAAAG